MIFIFIYLFYNLINPANNLHCKELFLTDLTHKNECCCKLMQIQVGSVMFVIFEKYNNV